MANAAQRRGEGDDYVEENVEDRPSVSIQASGRQASGVVPGGRPGVRGVEASSIGSKNISRRMSVQVSSSKHPGRPIVEAYKRAKGDRLWWRCRGTVEGRDQRSVSGPVVSFSCEVDRVGAPGGNLGETFVGLADGPRIQTKFFQTADQGSADETTCSHFNCEEVWSPTGFSDLFA